MCEQSAAADAVLSRAEEQIRTASVAAKQACAYSDVIRAATDAVAPWQIFPPLNPCVIDLPMRVEDLPTLLLSVFYNLGNSFSTGLANLRGCSMRRWFEGGGGGGGVGLPGLALGGGGGGAT